MYKQITANKRKTVLLMTFFVIFLLVVGYFLDYANGSQGFFLVIAIGLAFFSSFISYFAGDKIALASTGARAITKTDSPYVYRMVENLCITAGLPMPKIYLIPDAAPNAFATGRDPQHASIALTTGIVAALNNEELEGVIAHELSHVKNYDIRLMTIVGVLVGALVLMTDFFLRGQLFGFGGRRGNDDNNGGGQLGLILLVVGIVLAILSPLLAQIIQLSISRRREFLADADGALLTRYPEGLAGALEKISAYSRPMAKASNGTAHLFIINPFGKKKSWLTGLFATHPPVEARVKALREMIGQV